MKSTPIYLSSGQCQSKNKSENGKYKLPTKRCFWWEKNKQKKADTKPCRQEDFVKSLWRIK